MGFPLKPGFPSVAYLVVIPEGDLLLPLPLPLLLLLFLSLFVLAVILSAAKDPGTLHTTHTARTFQPGSSSLPGNAQSQNALKHFSPTNCLTPITLESGA